MRDFSAIQKTPVDSAKPEPETERVPVTPTVQDTAEPEAACASEANACTEGATRLVYTSELEEAVFLHMNRCTQMQCEDEIAFCSMMLHAMQSRNAHVCVLASQPISDAAALTNGLLGKKALLSTSIPPVLLPMIEIHDGETDSVMLQSGDKQKEYTLSELFWRKCADTYMSKSDQREAWQTSRICLETPASFLRKHQCTLWQYASITPEQDAMVLLESSCAIFVTSAWQALPMTDMAFLQKLPQYGIKSVIVALMHVEAFDQPDDQLMVLQSVREKLATLPLKSMLFIDTPDAALAGEDTLQGYNALRRYLQTNVLGDTLVSDHEAQMRGALAGSVSRAIKYAEQQCADAQVQVHNAQTQTDAKKREVEGDRDKYLIIRTAMMQRYEAAQAYMRKTINTTREDALGELQYSLENASDLSRWVESIYPHALRSILTKLANVLDTNLGAQYRKDLDWLKKIMEKTWQQTIERDDNISLADRNLIAELRHMQEVDIESASVKRKRERLQSTLVTAGGMFVSVLMGIPAVGVIAGGLYAVLSIDKQNKMTNELKSKVEIAVQQEVLHTLTEVEHMTDRNLKNAYMGTATLVSALEDEWIQKQQDRIDQESSADTDAHVIDVWMGHVADGAELLKKLQAAKQ